MLREQLRLPSPGSDRVAFLEKIARRILHKPDELIGVDVNDVHIVERRLLLAAKSALSPID